MKVLLTGANGYIGKRLLPVLLEKGHDVICCVRDKNRLKVPEVYKEQIEVYEIDFVKDKGRDDFPVDFDIAYYLIHSMSSSIDDFEKMELKSAENFVGYINRSKARQIVYLSGIANEEKLSRHLKSRKRVEEVIKNADANFTILRAGIIVGSGSASFEIIRDLVEKLPVMITPKWLNTRCQPVSIRDVIKYLTEVMMHPRCLNDTFDIGGPEVLTYKEMLNGYARVRNLKRFIFTLPVMTPRLSSYWLYFITSTSYKLAVNLVNSMKVEVVCSDDRLEQILKVNPITYEESVRKAFEKIEQHLVESSWKDSLITSSDLSKLENFAEVPRYGCFTDTRRFVIDGDRDDVLERIWHIGGNTGWYYADFLWKMRGFIDKLFGGAGLRRGRTNPDDLAPGDALDFWRVLIADRKNKRLLLYAEMKLPGEAWLEFKIKDNNEKPELIQTATFRPEGLLGRIYWYSVLPFHALIFEGMAKRIAAC